MAEASSGTSQLRRAIDSGQTRDKVDFPDLAAAPLGTDDEAAGTPPTAHRVQIAAQHEIRPDPNHQQGRGIGAAWVLIACVVVLALGMFALFRIF